MKSSILKDKVIVVVGGTKGLGKGVVIECAKQGAKVVIADRDEIEAAKILNELDQLGSDSIFVYTDLQKTDDCTALFDKTYSKYQRLDGYFNYAGITTESTLLECNEEHFNTMFNINIRGPLFCCKSAVKYMIASGGGSIVLTGSPHAWAGDEDRVAYACSKGAIITLSNHIGKHYAKYGIRANFVTMGWTPTEGEISLREAQGISERELRRWAAAVIPAGRMTEVDDLVPGVVYLLSDQSKMVSGSNLRMTGGWFM
jgi:NAD(P)-dependent dehydrogenase (short-subunit alcohol dehydrogenase family)